MLALLTRELDDLLRLVEASIPANPSSADNEKLAKRTEELMAAYFKQLEQAFPYQQLEAIYNRHVKVTESGPIGETEDILDPILKVFRAKILTDLVGQHVTAYLSGSAQMISWGTTKLGLPVLWEGPPLRQAIDFAQKHCAKLVTKMDEESKRLIAQVVADGIENKRGIDGLARDIRGQFDDMSRTRSQVIARTETADALEQAFMDRAEDMGINGKEWIVADPCPICEENGNAGMLAIDDEFPSGHKRPPAHPNAVFAESPFVSYGSLFQIVRSKYSGPARSIKTDRVEFTIGPNHPILTQRGWVKASEINEGDHLIYDNRIEIPGITRMESYFNKMPTIQDVFNSLMPMFGYATIASSRAYFHSDEVFAYGKVDVILPAGNLLPVLDASEIKEFCENNFIGANANIPSMASISSSHNAFNRVGVTTPGIVGSSNLIKSLFWGHLLPSPFDSTTVTHVKNLHYDGWAYDASTSTGLYNSSGIVVKNCRCALAPVMIKEK